MIKAYGFIQTYVEACIYKKVSGSSIAFLILYVDDILLIGNDIEFLYSIKGYLNKSFSQVQGVDYDEIFSSVAMLKSVGIMLALAAFMKSGRWMSKLHS